MVSNIIRETPLIFKIKVIWNRKIPSIQSTKPDCSLPWGLHRIGDCLLSAVCFASVDDNRSRLAQVGVDISENQCWNLREGID